VCDSGYLPDLFLSVKGAGTPGVDKPYLHLICAVGGALTWKNMLEQNAYLFPAAECSAFDALPEPLKPRAEWLKTNPK
jgi:hypothetical protein